MLQPQDFDFLACKVFMMFMREEFNYAKVKWKKIEHETRSKFGYRIEYNFETLNIGDSREYGNVNERQLRNAASMSKRRQLYLRVKTLSNGRYLVTRIAPQ